MDTAHLEGLIGMLTVLGLLALLILPSAIGIAHDRRVDRQIREAERARRQAPRPTERPSAGRPHYPATTVTRHS